MSGADGVGSAAALRCALVAGLGIACVQALAGRGRGEQVSMRALVAGLGIACVQTLAGGRWCWCWVGE
jgi:hypothetical protein